jgi:hypothetical protein
MKLTYFQRISSFFGSAFNSFLNQQKNCFSEWKEPAGKIRSFEDGDCQGMWSCCGFVLLDLLGGLRREFVGDLWDEEDEDQR